MHFFHDLLIFCVFCFYYCWTRCSGIPKLRKNNVTIVLSSAGLQDFGNLLMFNNNMT